MFDYKDAAFYDEYFKNQEGFSLIENFKPSEDEEEKNLYVGQVEALGTVHPLSVRVEIPFTFPHNKLVFRTKSLSGYPHLIHTGKIQYGDWFCLNTPFAETAEGQLDEEVRRLKEWIDHQMRADLPAVIKDPQVKAGLALANAYEWENPDEVKEFSSNAWLTFVGESHNDVSKYDQVYGNLHCVKSRTESFYVLDNSSCTDYELPYVIVDKLPSFKDEQPDFLKLKEYYGWDEDMCKHLLPGFNLSWETKYTNGFPTEVWSEEEILNKCSEIEEELRKEESFLPKTKKTSIPAKVSSKGFSMEEFRKEFSEFSKKIDKEEALFASGKKREKKPKKEQKDQELVKVLNAQKEAILKEIYQIKESVQKYHKYPVFQNLSEEEQMLVDYQMEVYPYEHHFFALGYKKESSIHWYIVFTTHSESKYDDEFSYDLDFEQLVLHRMTSCPLQIRGSQTVSEEMFYGRGAFSPSIKSQKVAIVGLGAIGSMVAAAMAHSGVPEIGLWDGDIVEPGNICRSSYSLKDIGESKVQAMTNIIKSINPFGKVTSHGSWQEYNVNYQEYIGGSFYDNVNYNGQETATQEIAKYNLIIDCTGSNEMLHFLSYAVPQAKIVSMCITNHAQDLLCVTNRDGNPFELRKAYLSRIVQDTKNFYVEGSGCYSPTFLATHCDIAALVNLALGDLDRFMKTDGLMHSSIYSYTERGIVADRISTYKLKGYDILLNIPSETMFDALGINDISSGEIGYLFGSYSRNGKQILITHIVDSQHAKELLSDAYATSKGLIDYIGDYRYSGPEADTYTQSSFDEIAAKAENTSINTNNPLLAVRNPDVTVSFFLYINNELVKFDKQD